jgi:UDP-glucose/GDP-mannose dehydrogenase family, UDP binding domain
LAGEINTAMPDYVVHRVAEALNDKGKAIKGSRILILGLAYKPNVDDERESPNYRLLEKLAHRGADVAYHDPLCARDSPNTRTPSMGGNRVRSMGPSFNRGVRSRCHRGSPCLRELSGTRQLGAVHCGHPEYDGGNPGRTR